MNYFKKLLFAVTLTLSSLGVTSFSANAGVIVTQDIFSGFGQLGTVSIEIADSDVNNGLVSVFDFVEIEIFGLGSFGLEVYDFEAVIDGDNVAAGLEFLYFDLEELLFTDNWSYQLIFDAFDTAANFLDIFDSAGAPVYFSDQVSLGDAQISYVSEPSLIALFGLALVGMGVRRRKLRFS